MVFWKKFFIKYLLQLSQVIKKISGFNTFTNTTTQMFNFTTFITSTTNYLNKYFYKYIYYSVFWYHTYYYCTTECPTTFDYIIERHKCYRMGYEWQSAAESRSLCNNMFSSHAVSIEDRKENELIKQYTDANLQSYIFSVYQVYKKWLKLS